MNADHLFLAIGWIIVLAFFVTFVLTILGLIRKVDIDPKHFQPLFYSLLLEVVAAAFFLFYAGVETPSEPYVGIWRGTMTWKATDQNNLSQDIIADIDQLVIARTPSQSYLGLFTGRTRAPQVDISGSAEHFRFAAGGELLSFNLTLVPRETEAFEGILNTSHSIQIDTARPSDLQGTLIASLSAPEPAAVGYAVFFKY